MEEQQLPKDDIDWDHTYECGCRVKMIPEIHSVVYGQCDWHWRLSMAMDFEDW